MQQVPLRNHRRRRGSRSGRRSLRDLLSRRHRDADRGDQSRNRRYHWHAGREGEGCRQPLVGRQPDPHGRHDVASQRSM